MTTDHLSRSWAVRYGPKIPAPTRVAVDTSCEEFAASRPAAEQSVHRRILRGAVAEEDGTLFYLFLPVRPGREATSRAAHDQAAYVASWSGGVVVAPEETR